MEFLVDDGTMSFMEVNTRIQVEHPVTEAVTGVDLVAAQLAIAEGAPVEAVPGLESGVTPEPRGHAMEFRINAEDPSLGFVPFPGIVESLQVPTGPGIRFDSGVAAGDSISSRYDSMIAKLIVKAPRAPNACAVPNARSPNCTFTACPPWCPSTRRCSNPQILARAQTGGPTTMCPMRISACTRAGLRRSCCRICPRKRLRTGVAPASGRWASVRVRPLRWKSWVEVDGKRVTLGLPASFASMMAFGAGMAHAGGHVPATGASGADSDLLAALLGGIARGGSSETAPDGAVQGGTVQGGTPVTAELGGTVVRWLADDGAPVREGDLIVVLEAMKMEREALAPATGTLHITVPVGEQADYGAVLGTID